MMIHVLLVLTICWSMAALAIDTWMHIPTVSEMFDSHAKDIAMSPEFEARLDGVAEAFNSFTSAFKASFSNGNQSAIIDNIMNANYDKGMKHVGVSANARRVNGIELTAAPSFTCERLPEHYDPTMFCSGVVDYSFFLASGMTKDQLESYVRLEAQRAIPLFSAQCKSDIKRLICAKYYLPCVDSVVPDDYSTYQLIGYIPVPFKRPCSSLCTATTYLGGADSCHGLLEALSLNFDCTANAYGLPFPEYDASNDPLQCNLLESTQGQLVVAQAAEPYVGVSCTGINEEYYVQAPADPTLAPLLPPFIAQSIAEAGVTSILDKIPRFLPAQCLDAVFKLFCPTLLMKPYETHLLDSFFGPTYFPSFPAKSLCLDFNDQCTFLIDMVPALKVDCDLILPGTSLELYPEHDQTVAAIPLGPYTVVVQTPPNTLDGVTVDVAVECPRFFSPPEKVTGLEALIGGCALDCPFNMFKFVDATLIIDEVAFAITFTLMAIAVFNLTVIPAGKRNLYQCLIVGFKVILLLLNLLQLLTIPLKKRGCETPTSSFSLPPHQYADTVCVAQSVGVFIDQYVITSCVLCTILELWLRVVWSVKNIIPYQRMYRAVAFLLFSLHLLSLQFMSDSLQVMTVPGGTSCYLISSDADTFYLVSYIPLCVYYGTGLALFAHVIYVCIKISQQSASKAERWYFKVMKYWKLYKTLFIILIIFFLTNGVVILLRTYFQYSDNIMDPKPFILCLFKNFISHERDGTLEACGDYPEGSGNDIWLMSILLFWACQWPWILLTVGNTNVRNFWFSKFQLLFGKAAFKITAESSMYRSEAATSEASNDNGDSNDDSNDDKIELARVDKPIGAGTSFGFGEKVVPLSCDVEKGGEGTVDFESKNCD